jgi:2-aminobenzoate-CoA ligase
VTSCTAHVDTFAREHLPPTGEWPEFMFEHPRLHYPERVNCATVLLDDALREGYGEQLAVVSEARCLTYRELQAESNRIANVLTDIGVVPGNRVLLRGCNEPTLVACWLAVMKVGAIAVTTMPLLRAKELAQIIAKGQIRHALCDQRLLDELHAATGSAAGWCRTLVWGTGELEGHSARASPEFRNVETAAEDTCLLAFTSGTSGEPKACMHFHRDVLVSAEIVGGELLGTCPEDRYAGSPPLGFTFGLGALLVFPLRFRATAVLVESATAESLLQAVQKWHVTCLFSAPTAYRTMLGQLDKHDVSSLTRCVSAGEPLPQAISDAWHGRTSIRIMDGIGATEMFHIFISTHAGDVRPGATGKPLPGYDACVLGESGEPLPAGSVGRLAVRGPTGCRYLDDARQRQYVQRGWNVTGDLYRMDEEGYFWFQARADDIILSSGYNIAAPEVEWALHAHPAVKDCAVVGSSDPDRGMIVKAFVEVRTGCSPTAALAREIQDFVKQHIAPYKYPRVVEFVEELPRTSTGKVRRSVLRQMESARGNKQPP